MKVLKAISPYIVILGVIVLLAVVITSMIGGKEISYSQFVLELEQQNVETVKLEDHTAEVVLKNDSASDKDLKAGKYSVKVLDAATFEQLMISQTEAANPVKYTAKVKTVPFIVRIIPYVLLAILVMVFIYLFFSQSQTPTYGKYNYGRSNARLYSRSQVKFEDVAGAVEEKEEMQELVEFLKDPKRYDELGARIPKGVLLVGPPGTGKTYLAKAVAGEAGVPFFSISGSDFVEMFVGVGAARVRDLFEQAKKNSPCIVFIDEIDAVGRHRGAGLGGGHDEREQTLNQLLVAMDGFEKNEGIIVMAATNRPDILDPALTRPGRFDRKINVGYPDIKAREAILKVHSRKKPLAEDVDLSEVAKNTAGFTPADLENLLNEGALIAARDHLKEIGSAQIKEATFRVIVGKEKKSHVMTEKDRWVTAVHEVGHALAVRFLSTTDKVDRISVIPAGSAGGYTAHRPDEDSAYLTRSQLLEMIDVNLGGRAAEDRVLGDISTGATSDLQNVSSLARAMVVKYGMSDRVGNIVFDSASDDEIFLGKEYGHSRTYSDETAALIDSEVKRIVDEEYAKVLGLISDKKELLEKIAKVLIEKERLEAEEFEELINS